MSLEFFVYSNYLWKRQYCYSMQLDSTIDRDPTQESRFGTPSRGAVRGGGQAGAEGTLAPTLPRNLEVQKREQRDKWTTYFYQPPGFENLTQLCSGQVPMFGPCGS